MSGAAARTGDYKEKKEQENDNREFYRGILK